MNFFKQNKDFFAKNNGFSNKNKGFSIIELVVVMAIIAILIFIAAPSVSKSIQKTQEQGVDTAASTIQTVTRAKLRELDGRTDIPTSIYAHGSNLYNEIFTGSGLSTMDSTLIIESYKYDTLPTKTAIESEVRSTPNFANFTNWVVCLPNHYLSDTDLADDSKINIDLEYPIIIFCVVDGETTKVYEDGLNVTDTY